MAAIGHGSYQVESPLDVCNLPKERMLCLFTVFVCKGEYQMNIFNKYQILYRLFWYTLTKP